MSKENALTIIQNARKNGSLVFVEQNFMPQTDLYRPEVTTITLKKEDCHNISGKFMPKREFIDRIGEAAGIVFNDVRGHTETIDDPSTGKSLVFVGRTPRARSAPPTGAGVQVRCRSTTSIRRCGPCWTTTSPSLRPRPVN